MEEEPEQEEVEKEQDKEEEEEKQEEQSPKKTTASIEEVFLERTSFSPCPTQKEIADTLSTLSTPIKPKMKRQRSNPLYFKTMKSTRINQGRLQTLTKAPIIIEESPSKKEEIGPTKRKVEEVKSPATISKTLIAYVSRITTGLTSHEKPKAPTTLQEKEEVKI